jgi:hypothetical protein
MIKTVSTWRCKCGAHVRVVAQTPKAKPSANQKAACPNCGDTQIIYGETILSIISDAQAEVYWSCACGAKVKALLDMNKAGVAVQCPNPPCQATRTLPGQITHLWVKTERGVWKEVDLGLLRPAD